MGCTRGSQTQSAMPMSSFFLLLFIRFGVLEGFYNMKQTMYRYGIVSQFVSKGIRQD